MKKDIETKLDVLPHLMLDRYKESWEAIHRALDDWFKTCGFTTKTQLVIAGSAAQYKDWVREYAGSRQQSTKHRYVRCPEHIVGIDENEYELVYYGESHRNPLYGSDYLKGTKAFFNEDSIKYM